MNADDDRLNERFDAASHQLRGQLIDQDVPNFSPTRQTSPMVIVLLIVGLAVSGALLLDRGEPSEVELTDPIEIEDGLPTVTTPVPEPDEATTTSTIPLVEGRDTTPASTEWDRPPLGEPYADPAFGLTVRRVTDATDVRLDRLDHSGQQIENADGTAILTYRDRGSWQVVDTSTLKAIDVLDIHPDAEPVWHPTDSSAVRHLGRPNDETSLSLFETTIGGSTEVVADLSDRIRTDLPTASYMLSKFGSPSADGTRFAWAVHDADHAVLGFVSYDVSTDTILGMTAEPPGDDGGYQSVSMSPSGSYVVASFGSAFWVFDADLQNPRRIDQNGESWDLALTANRTDALVTVNFTTGTPDAGWVVWYDLDTLASNRLIDLFDDANTTILLSGKAYDKPGWIIASTFACRGEGLWTCDKVMAIELATLRVVHLAHTYSCAEEYFAQPEATPSRDLSRVYFNSDAGSCDEKAEVYEASVPSLETS